MTNTLTKHDVKQIFRCLDQVKDLCDYMRNNHMDAPYQTVYGAVGGEGFIRELLMSKIITDVQIEAPDMTPTIPGAETKGSGRYNQPLSVSTSETPVASAPGRGMGGTA